MISHARLLWSVRTSSHFRRHSYRRHVARQRGDSNTVPQQPTLHLLARPRLHSLGGEALAELASAKEKTRADLLVDCSTKPGELSARSIMRL